LAQVLAHVAVFTLAISSTGTWSCSSTMADTMMLSPMPCKAIQSPCSLPKSPYTRSELDNEELDTARPFWYDVDEATQDLRDVLTCKTPKNLPEWMPAFEARSSSAASTCATSPPACRFSESSSPAWTFLDDGLESPTHAQTPQAQTPQKTQCPPGALDKSSWLQARKVFVGGIPQSVDQNGLYQMFSNIGKVKKAWLQLFHNDRAATQNPSTKKHRGFGFVIFYEKQAIDQLLGNDLSRFISFGNEKLEVKRAFGKTSECTPDHQPSTGKSNKPQMNSPQCSLSSSHAPQICRSPQTPGIVLPDTRACQIGSHMASQAWQGIPAQAQLVVAYPCVPPFPLVDTRAVPALVEHPAPQSQQSAYTFVVPGVLLHGLVGQRQAEQRAVDNQALTQALLQAMPDHYED